MRDVSPVCTPSWTFARSNHAAIMAISASPSSSLVWFPGAICKVAEREMRLICCSLANLEDVLEGATVKFARRSRSPPHPRWSSEGGGVISRRQRWRQSLDLQCVCNAQTSLACRLISGKETGPKPTDWWGFVSNYSTYCNASPKNWKMRSSPQP